MNNDITVYDNFLSKEEFEPLQNFMIGEDCPWYFNRFTHIDQKEVWSLLKQLL